MAKIKILFKLLNMAIIAVSAIIKIMQLHEQARLASGQSAAGRGGTVPPPPQTHFAPPQKPVFYRVTVHDTQQGFPAGAKREYYEMQGK